MSDNAPIVLFFNALREVDVWMGSAVKTAYREEITRQAIAHRILPRLYEDSFGMECYLEVSFPDQTSSCRWLEIFYAKTAARWQVSTSIIEMDAEGNSDTEEIANWEGEQLDEALIALRSLGESLFLKPFVRPGSQST
jgi:hypothetical protein